MLMQVEMLRRGTSLWRKLLARPGDEGRPVGFVIEPPRTPPGAARTPPSPSNTDAGTTRRTKRWPASLGVLLCVSSPPHALAVDEDAQAWAQFIATKKIEQGVTATLEVQPRFAEDASRLGQLLIRPSIGFRVLDQAVLSLGYAYVRTSPGGGAVTHEHRPWQQLAFPIASRPGLFTLSNRTRLEQRRREDGDRIGLRLRQQLRLMVPIAKTQWQAVVWSEAFFNLNDTDWGPEAGLDRWRNFAGIAIPLRTGVTLEPGYLNQYINRAATDQIDHVIGFTLNANF